MVRLQQQTVMPFIMTQQLHIPPASIVQRFCTMLQAILSSQEQEMRMPPWHFSIFTLQRGTISQLAPAGTPAGAPRPWAAPVAIPGKPIPVRSSIIALDM
jgi:hypothetical protein